MLTDFDAIVSIAQTLLRARGQWRTDGTATSARDIEHAVIQSTDLIAGTRIYRTSAIAELKRRAGYGS